MNELFIIILTVTLLLKIQIILFIVNELFIIILTVTLLLKIQIMLFIVKELFMIILTVTLLFKYRSVSDLLASSKFQVSFQCGRAQRSLLHIAAK